MRPVIHTEFVFPPIPDRRWDWSAATDNYEPGAPIGYGPTEEAAIADLLEQLDDAEDTDDEKEDQNENQPRSGGTSHGTSDPPAGV